MARVGYMRFSTADQNGDAQRDALESAGCGKIFEDAGVSGKLARRPGLDACLAYLRQGDTLVITKLDRLGRSVRNLVEEAGALGERGIDLVVLHQGIDTTTPAGKLMFHMLAAIAEFERDLVRERTMDGLRAARARGRKGGRKPKLSPLQARKMLEMYEERGEDGAHVYTPHQVAKTYGVSHQTLYSYRDRRLSAAGKANSDGEDSEKQQRDKGAGEHAEA